MVSPQVIKSGTATPGELPLKEKYLREVFVRRVHDIPGGERIHRCIQCGTCSGSCPVSWAMDIMPRELIARFRAGDIASLLHTQTIWICASCYACSERCPQKIRVTEIIYSLKRLAIDSKILPKRDGVHKLPRLFVNIVNKYGRNHELGLIMKFYLRTDPLRLLRMASLGFAMMRKGRIQINPPRIKKASEDLRLIIARARKLEMPHEKFSPEYYEAMVGYRAIDHFPAESK